MFTKKELEVLLLILDEINYLGYAEFARLDDEQETAAQSAEQKLQQLYKEAK